MAPTRQFPRTAGICEVSILTESPTTFADLGINPALVAALDIEGITHPFPIQEQAIPIAMQGTDLIGQARTGTGKTLAFGLPILERITLPAPDRRPQALVMCPTRELASQVAGDLETAASGLDVNVLTVYGGVGYEPQLDQLARGVDVVVGTPGRLLDLLGRRNLDLSAVSILVLDEADEMLDLGFLPDVEKLIAAVPADRQTLLFSATMPAAIVTLARTHLAQPVNIRAEAAEDTATVPETAQHVFQAHDLDKPAIVGKLLQVPGATRVMIFCTTKREVQRLADDLTERGFKVTSLHGDLSQVVREKSLAKFRAGKAQTIVCTDVAARGIDVDDVTHVINYDCPDDEKTYLHRIGRTARAGKTGIAVTFVDWADIPRWKMINKALDLGFPEPVEAYSTTPQLLEELEIPADATGRLVAAPVPPVKTKPSEAKASTRKPGRRQRRSNGVVIREKTEHVKTPKAQDEGAPRRHRHRAKKPAPAGQ
ncbi:MAG: DEAD/DEAH box helicase [Propionibacteriaceae bacterium]|jgi:superfamily II DNA/RNA helicase|nr:DEAD/DEAH box helicase [Propionibacteriaceae bacterium]